ncbi:MAG: CoA-binding protein [Chloroflexota bacterium]|nr:CoA-binding protein [Chloroflexota bacterium]
MSTDGSTSLEYLFHPRSIAFAGVSRIGQALLESHLSAGFEGTIYPISRSLTEVFGLPCYADLNDIPDSVDYVFAFIPAKSSPQFVRDCIAKEVKLVAFFTAGFSEKDEEGARLEAELAALVRGTGTRILGPNCMGIYCPATGLSLAQGLPRESGPVGLFGQSGGNTTYAIRAAVARGAYFTKALSYGNACDLNECDLLDHFARDPDTRVIAAYMEGLKDAGRFSTLLREVTCTKPVVVLKGGHTPLAAATASAHTGSVPVADDEWDALMSQAGAIQVHDVDEMADVITAFLFMPPPRGRNVNVTGLGGGASVVSADHCVEAGLTMPSLPDDLRQRLATFVNNPAGNIFVNPVDPQATPEGTDALIRAIADWDGVDMLFLRLPHNITPFYQDPGQSLDVLIQYAAERTKPTAVILEYVATPEGAQLCYERQQACAEAGVASFPSVQRAARAMSKLIEYHERRAATS